MKPKFTPLEKAVSEAFFQGSYLSHHSTIMLMSLPGHTGNHQATPRWDAAWGHGQDTGLAGPQLPYLWWLQYQPLDIAVSIKVSLSQPLLYCLYRAVLKNGSHDCFLVMMVVVIMMMRRRRKKRNRRGKRNRKVSFYLPSPTFPQEVTLLPKLLLNMDHS